MTRSGSEKRGEKIGIHKLGRRGKRKLDEVQKESSSKRHKFENSVAKQSTKKLEICDLEPPPAKMAMPYMISVQYEKPVPPDRSHGEKRKGGSIDRSIHRVETSTKPSNSRMKQSTPMLLITDGRLGHSDLPIDDDDFVEAPSSWKGTSIHEDSPSGERKSEDTTDSDDMPSKDVSSLKSDQQKKLKLLVRMQGEIRTDMLDIKSHTQCMSDSVTTLISSSMEEIMKKFRENSGPETVGGSGPTSEAAKVEQSVDSKGKAKVDFECAVEFPFSIEPPSFDLGLGFTQPSQFVVKTSKEVEVQVDSIISNLSPEAAPSSRLPMKRTPKPAKALQSPYIVDEMKQMKSSGNVVVFEHYNQNEEVQ
ncbi:Hypothetical predicted protein [Olea europaea subsp. europaea]|uniref:Uncharacterized protein n=1 Tax=Olea europaea subsp. europaea TaxID=158383 RepID=A0A8S0QXA8_OLEEU|nr:Hypothetical predicted protein [Olea europaea subsp. europaea]